MKLLQINSVINTGSTGRIAEEIGQKALALGWESYIAYGRENNRPSDSKKIRIGNDLDIKLHGLRTRIFDNHSLGQASRLATKKLVSEIEKISPDIIHLHNLHGYYLNIEALFDYLRTSSTPVVWTLHDCWAFTGHCTYFELANCNKWQTHCHHCPISNKYPASYLIDRSKKNFSEKRELFTSLKNLTLIPVSHWLKNLIQKSFLKSIPTSVIYNGIDTQIFKPYFEQVLQKKYNLNDKFILLGVASEWSVRKGLEDYIKLSKELDNDHQIVLIGLSQKQIRELPDNIIGIEKTENVVELAQYYSDADLILNISYVESFGLTTVEGFACGTPGIVYNATASPELIDKSTGMIVEKGNIAELVSAINQMRETGKSYFSEACINRVKNHFDKEKQYQDYFDLYNRLINNRN